MTALQPLPIDRLLGPFREFTRASAAGGVLLMAAAAIALLWANSPWAESYESLWQTPVTIGASDFSVTKPLLLWINDGLMVIFFLVVGLEIKREVLVGELASRRRATLPLVAAVGGAVLPALIYVAIVGGGEGARGWGIPMATDIAFALGVLALLGSRVPVSLRIFLTALAIVDDLLAVLVIAVFYTEDLSLPLLAGAGVVLLVLVAANRAGVRHPLVYAALGILLWLLVLRSGVHATVAGVLLAMTIPARTRIDPGRFVHEARTLVERFERTIVQNDESSVEEHHDALWELETVTEQAQAPMLRMEHALHPWVSFLIVPLFALANAGVTISADVLRLPLDPIILGVMLGLVVGKQVGITAATWLVVRAGLAALPDGAGWRHIYGVAWLGGIGFTMSLFIADLGLESDEQLAMAKVGILAASVIAGVGGYLLLSRWAGRRAEPGATA